MVQKSLPFPSLSRRSLGILLAATIISVSCYLLAAKYTYRIGFPLDDAWIHQTYARNLVEYGEWSFVPHETSGGSTAPLWSLLLTPGFIFNLGPLTWTYLLGTFILLFLAILVEYSVSRLTSGNFQKIPWVGLFLIFEWHLVWAAVSGMETLLSGLIITSVLALVAFGFSNYIALGLIIGAGIWVRPDLATLLGPCILVILLHKTKVNRKLMDLLKIFIGFGVILAFYLLFNLVTAGTPFPNTFYAKQAEYAVLGNISFVTRYLNIALLPVTGAGIFLVPGALILLIRSIKQRDWDILVGVIWFIGYIFIYAWRLPVTYQHGRYLIPAMPIFFMWGLMGMKMAIEHLRGPNWKWILSKVWQISTGITLISFWILGAKAYSTDVAVIESEMVVTAKWIAMNIPKDKLIAAHDIGALGYYAPRKLIDLAGLVSPEVIPFIRDEKQISEYLTQNNVDYLVVFPDWYTNLTNQLPVLFTSQGKFSPPLGHPNMSIYLWQKP